MRSTFLQALACQPTERRPVWLMRQAGRYLPEYQNLRQKHSLLSCFKEPELAASITHMPLNRFDFDAAILFSDLLVLVEVFDMELSYPEKKGPCIFPSLTSLSQLHIPSKEEIQDKLGYVFSTITLLKRDLKVPLIGFCGAPFTLLCYMLQGTGGKNFSQIQRWMEERPQEFERAMDCVLKACICFAQEQVSAGVDAFQVFDSWANLLEPELFSRYAAGYWKKMQEALEDCPSLFYSRANSEYPELISQIKPTCISFDERRPLSELRARVPKNIAVQGNFSQELLLRGTPSEVKQAAYGLVSSLEEEVGVIWNLGHGVLPKTPIDNVEALLEVLRSEPATHHAAKGGMEQRIASGFPPDKKPNRVPLS